MRLRERLLRSVSPLTTTAAVAIISFHVAVLFRRVGDGSIGQPAILVRWIGAVTVLAGFLIFRRRGPRASVVFWLVVLVLHLGGPAIILTELMFTTPLLVFCFLLAIASDLQNRSQAFKIAAAFLPMAPGQTSEPPRAPPLN
jgi:hypothetical protein